MQDFDDYRRQLLLQAQTLLPQWFNKPWVVEGDEFVALNPTRVDKSLGSFRINMKTGAYKDFAVKDFWGTNLLDLYAAINGHRNNSLWAYNELAGGKIQSLPLPAPRILEPVKSQKTPILPPSPPPRWMEESKSPSMVHEYRTIDDQLLGYVFRVNKEDGDKDFLPLFYFEEGGWQFKGFKGNTLRPLYNAQELTKKPHARVMITEGEKACDAAQRMLPDWVCLSIFGGAGAVKKQNLAILKGRDCVLWPDNDDNGRKAMAVLKDALKPLAKVSIVQFQHTVPKWDLANAETDGWTREAILLQVDEDVMPDEIGEVVTVANNPWFKCLGFQNEPEDKCWYFSHRASALRSFTPASLDQKKMLTMATDAQWKQMIKMNVADKGALNTAFALLFEECTNKGIFNPDCSRKVGLWHDQGRIVANMGDYLLVDGQKQSMLLDSKFIYEHTDQSEIDCEPATVEETTNIYDVCCMLNMTAYECWFLAGWIWLAPVCGVLNWRPTLWITGEAGSGKTTVLSRILNPLLGDFCFRGETSTTEAGIRQKLNGRVVPALFDEAEMENNKAAYTIKEVLRLARGSSSKDGASIIKGSATGEAKRYTIRSMFCFLSIKSGATESSDLTRVTTLWMKKDAEVGSERRYAELCYQFDNIMTREMGHRMIMRSILEVKTTLKVIELFINLITTQTNDSRLADQIGPLLAGSWMMCNTRLPEADEIEVMVKEVDWNRLNQRTFDSDHASALAHLLSTKIEHQEPDSPTRKMIISELIAMVLMQNEVTANSPSLPEVLSLNRVGIHLLPRKKVMRISNKNPELRKLFRNTPWAVNWNETLKNIACAFDNKDPMAMGRGFKKERCLDIPLEATGIEWNAVDEPEPLPLPEPNPYVGMVDKPKVEASKWVYQDEF